jgi:regulatory protein
MNTITGNGIQHWVEKARRYCDQQERCIVEVERKLRDWGCEQEKSKQIIKLLVKDKIIDEQRFANSFASGKFRIKSWGKSKIMAGLYQHKISPQMINEALAGIDDKEYRDTLIEVLTKKWKLTSGEPSTRTNKTASYAIGKGFESPLVFEVLKSINKE